MVITIENDLQTFLDLLWIREAWQLAPGEDDLPPRLVVTPTPEPAMNEAQHEAWSSAWPEIWHSCLSHAAQERDQDAFNRLSSPSTEPQERLELLARLTGPSWQDWFGDSAFTAQRGEWELAMSKELSSPHSMRREPERDCVEALVPAWRAGLTNIIAIPCRGTFTRRLSTRALLVTAETRDAPNSYSEALRSFV